MLEKPTYQIFGRLGKPWETVRGPQQGPGATIMLVRNAAKIGRNAATEELFFSRNLIGEGEVGVWRSGHRTLPTYGLGGKAVGQHRRLDRV